VPEGGIPELLRRRQFVRFDAGLGITRPLAQLADALRQDLDWIREHTRLGEITARWESRGRPEALLLRGDEVVAAVLWAERRKPEAPAVTGSMRALIAASKQAEEAHLLKSKQTQRRARWVQTFAALCVTAVLVTLAGWWQESWLKEHIYAWRNVNVLTAAEETALKSGDPFQECRSCPEMIVVPAGSFMMGSPNGQGGDNEQPQHSVTIAKPFAAGKYELTFAEWDACGAQGDCNSNISDVGFGRDRQPVINVSWHEAKAYVAWLSKITGKTYRLLSEAEYEYAARGGTQTTYPWGENIELNGTAMANCFNCGSKWDGRQTAPVGSFLPNKFGLYDIVGNVWEWTEDCYHKSYDGAPADGSAWTLGADCSAVVARGGGWSTDAHGLRSASRRWNARISEEYELGFRVARSLTP
jgi:formylglycine-generating enzyme required for sulfatase activity